jgi:Phospholipase_D-nuclease N-terminal
VRCVRGADARNLTADETEVTRVVLFDGALGVVAFVLWIFCILDVITTPEGAFRHLPKIVWLLLVIVLLDVGSIVWLLAGRNWNAKGRTESMADARQPAPRARARATNPDDDDEFLAGLRDRAEEQRRQAREAQGDEPPSGASE